LELANHFGKQEEFSLGGLLLGIYTYWISHRFYGFRIFNSYQKDWPKTKAGIIPLRNWLGDFPNFP